MTGETGWTSRVGVLDGTYAVMVGRVDGPGIIRFQSNLAGRELPHCSAIGKALLSHLPDDGVRTIVARTGLPARTATTITDVDELLRELERVREQGFAVDDEEDSDGVVCVGASVVDHRRACVAAISLTGLKLTLPRAASTTWARSWAVTPARSRPNWAPPASSSLGKPPRQAS